MMTKIFKHVTIKPVESAIQNKYHHLFYQRDLLWQLKLTPRMY